MQQCKSAAIFDIVSDSKRADETISIKNTIQFSTKYLSLDTVNDFF